jgi:hypothetical protein
MIARGCCMFAAFCSTQISVKRGAAAVEHSELSVYECKLQLLLHEYGEFFTYNFEDGLSM